MFQTTVIGSLPRPEWVRQLILDRKEGTISENDADKLLDRAIESSILLQERAGLDEITDGEWRRESYVKVFAERVRGFKPDLTVSGLPYPAVVEPIEQYRPIAAEEVQHLRNRTDRLIKATIPGPYTIGRRMWHVEHSSEAYPSPADLMKACVPILRNEIDLLKDAGANTVQVDEPWLCLLVDPVKRAADGIENVNEEIDLCVEVVNETLNGVTGITTGIHLCHAHFDHQHGSEGPLDLIMPGLARIRADIISIELATPVSGSMECLSQFSKDANLGLGCIDHCDREIETPELVVRRVEEAMKYVDKERIILHPDCGFAPSVQNPIDWDEAYLKLVAMCQGAQILRSRYE